jgi:hypothetical protein
MSVGGHHLRLDRPGLILYKDLPDALQLGRVLGFLNPRLLQVEAYQQSGQWFIPIRLIRRDLTSTSFGEVGEREDQ